MNCPCLQIDLGNSSAKWRLVDDGQVLARGRYGRDDPASREALLGVAPVPVAIWVSSVADAEHESQLVTMLGERWGVEPWFARTPAHCAGLSNSYAEPQRMGVDRWLAMLGARARCADRLCVVDAGSALTIDLVDAGGRHEGGYIIPGARLMERALLLDTGRVRFEQDPQYDLAPGTSTAQAVRHGIALAQAGAVQQALAQAGEPAPALFFCGGDGALLRDLLGEPGEFAADLVFEGLQVMAAEQGTQ
ncbi:type III pantothenate kinase [Mangrovimicrobium sediminis]|uniref:Type III pantothenate kinase n=1 Tax=Mangrovimicrobium sediminis TaxID=2562682 RepID=A0A4Z0M8R5_9GAMM|nr:type III pantothenate kinase [Haliea sp. SAOS-164]TGD75685.1 type III pantothenate kinase [Haliea sp. SAOS-164]